MSRQWFWQYAKTAGCELQYIKRPQQRGMQPSKPFCNAFWYWSQSETLQSDGHGSRRALGRSMTLPLDGWRVTIIVENAISCRPCIGGRGGTMGGKDDKHSAPLSKVGVAEGSPANRTGTRKAERSILVALEMKPFHVVSYTKGNGERWYQGAIGRNGGMSG